MRTDAAIGLITLVLLGAAVFLVASSRQPLASTPSPANSSGVVKIFSFGAATPAFEAQSSPEVLLSPPLVSPEPSAAMSAAPVASVTTAHFVPTGSVTGSGTVHRDPAKSPVPLSIEAELAVPPSGQFYSVWLVKGERGTAAYQYFSPGRLAQSGHSFTLNTTVPAAYADYATVALTLESANPSRPGDTVFEARFKTAE